MRVIEKSILENINYKVSLYPTKKVEARHKTPAANKPYSEIIIYLSKITEILKNWINREIEYIQEHFRSTENAFFNYFVLELIQLSLLERICLECRLNNYIRVNRGLGKIRIRGRCKEFKKFPCKMNYVAEKIMDLLDF